MIDVRQKAEPGSDECFPSRHPGLPDWCSDTPRGFIRQDSVTSVPGIYPAAALESLRPAFRWSVSFPIVWHRNPDPAFCRATPHDQPHTVTISEIYFGIRSIRKAALKWQFESTRSQVLDKSQDPPRRGTRPQALLRPAQRPTARAESAKLLRGLAPAPPNISPE